MMVHAQMVNGTGYGIHSHGVASSLLTDASEQTSLQNDWGTGKKTM